MTDADEPDDLDRQMERARKRMDTAHADLMALIHIGLAAGRTNARIHRHSGWSESRIRQIHSQARPEFVVGHLEGFLAHVLPERLAPCDRKGAADGLVRWMSAETALRPRGGASALPACVLRALEGTGAPYDDYPLLTEDCALAGLDVPGSARALYGRLIRSGVSFSFEPAGG